MLSTGPSTLLNEQIVQIPALFICNWINRPKGNLGLFLFLLGREEMAEFLSGSSLFSPRHHRVTGESCVSVFPKGVRAGKFEGFQLRSRPVATSKPLGLRSSVPRSRSGVFGDGVVHKQPECVPKRRVSRNYSSNVQVWLFSPLHDSSVTRMLVRLFCTFGCFFEKFLCVVTISFVSERFFVGQGRILLLNLAYPFVVVFLSECSL